MYGVRTDKQVIVELSTSSLLLSLTVGCTLVGRATKEARSTLPIRVAPEPALPTMYSLFCSVGVPPLASVKSAASGAGYMSAAAAGHAL